MGTIKASTNNRLQEMKEKISVVEDTIEKIDPSVKGNIKSNKFLTQDIQEI